MDTRMCDFGGMLVPCGLVDQFAQLIHEAGPLQESLWYNPTGAFEMVVKPARKPPTLRVLTDAEKKKRKKNIDKLRRNHVVGNDETDPQQSGLGALHNANYEKCKGLSDIPERAANLIVDAANLEHADPTSIAVTMKIESSFGHNLKPNPRKDGHENFNGYFDVGWMQTANDPAIWNKSPYTDGLPNAYGSILAGQLLDFNGDPLENVRLGARALIASSGWKNRPKDVSPRADAAGIFRAGSRDPASYRKRVNEFNDDYRAYDRFFECMRNGKR